MIDGLEDRFEHHPPASPEIEGSHIEIRRLFSELASRIDSLVPDGREKSLTITKLEEAAMWANKAIALHGGRRP